MWLPPIEASQAAAAVCREGIGLDSTASSHQPNGIIGPGLDCRFAIADMAAIMCHVLQAESYSWPQANMRSGFNMQALHIVWSMDELWLQLLSS